MAPHIDGPHLVDPDVSACGVSPFRGWLHFRFFIEDVLGHFQCSGNWLALSAFDDEVLCDIFAFRSWIAGRHFNAQGLCHSLGGWSWFDLLVFEDDLLLHGFRFL